MKGEANVNIIHKGLSKILNFLSLFFFPAPLCFNATLNICAFNVTLINITSVTLFFPKDIRTKRWLRGNLFTKSFSDPGWKVEVHGIKMVLKLLIKKNQNLHF